MDQTAINSIVNSDTQIAILMCTYNGAAYLREQLDSFARQSFTNWKLYISDDGSSDKTLEILHEYQSEWGHNRIYIFNGPRMGFAKNFISLAKRLDIKADFYAFSDQDDIWHTNKLERSIEIIGNAPNNKPALYCSRTTIIDERGQKLGYSPLFSRPPSFKNALIQSLAGSNTMLINKRTKELIELIKEDLPVVAHDWASYMLVTGCGGTAFYDENPTVDYRQHNANQIGANSTLRARINRLKGMFSGRFKKWTDQNITLLSSLEKHLTTENKTIIKKFEELRLAPPLQQIILLKKLGLYRQTTLGNVSLIVAILLKQI